MVMTIARLVLAMMCVHLLGLGNGDLSAQVGESDPQPLTTSEVAERFDQPGWRVVDVRDSNAFNGWILGDELRGGHIRGATNLSLAWMQTHLPAALRAVELKRLKKNKVILYGNAAGEAHQMAGLLREQAHLSPKQIFIYTEGIEAWSRDSQLPMDKLPRYEKLVSPRWVHRLIEAGPLQDYRIVEVNWQDPQQFMAGHLPGAVYLDTNEIESEPTWNVVSADQLEATLLSLGITKNTRVILYGRDTTAAARAAVVMMYAGVSDVRLLNGGYQAWLDAGFPVEGGDVPRRPAIDFGGKIPLHPEWIVGAGRATEVLAAQDGRLVSIRSWPEYIGQTSGYSYIKRKGRIRGAVWGHAGTDSSHMQDYRNPDNSLRDYHEITANWRASDIARHNEISFYCGTGWRASEALFAAYLMGYEKISVYDGGWHEWSANPTNPIATGAPPSTRNNR